MALVTVREILTPRPQGWAVGAFNVHNMEDVQAVVWAAEELKAPVILQVSESALKYAGAPYLAGIVKAAAEESTVPIALQLDHGRDFELIRAAVKAGFTSIMFDGSHLPYEENVRETRKVVELAHAHGLSVEGELGRVGGKEDNIEVATNEAFLTNPEQAAEFVEATGIDLLAPAVGTMHGLYRGEPKVDFERLQEIREVVAVPLVLHGGSDLPTEVIARVIKIGVDKINVGTDLKYAMTDGVREYLGEHPQEMEPRKVFGAARAKGKLLVGEKLKLFNSNKRCS